jgi:predicted nuclease of restriction endonuclease-like (RecB) superfamily
LAKYISIFVVQNILSMEQTFSTDKQYKKWITELKGRIQGAQIKAAVAVNRQLLELYWDLGREICEKQKKAEWGDGLIEQLAKDLSAEFPGVKGFSRANLFFIKKWFLFYQSSGIVSQVVRQIPWGHNRVIIIKCATIESALLYVQKTIQNNWSRAVLVAQMESKLYERSGKIINNFDTTLAAPQADLARETLKNPYNFDFLTLGEKAKERDLENALTDHIQHFLLELGQGFAYMGRQYPLDVGGDHFYLDLLFYHTRLRCYVVVELKAAEFVPEFAGKLNFYLNVVNAQLKHVQDQPSIGILLCKTPNKVIVEYALENILSPLGVAEYQITNAIPENLKGELPSSEELEQELEGRELSGVADGDRG